MKTVTYFQKRDANELYQALKAARKSADRCVRKVVKADRGQLAQVDGAVKYPSLHKYAAAQGSRLCLIDTFTPKADAVAPASSENPLPTIQAAEAKIRNRETQAANYVKTANQIMSGAIAPIATVLTGCGIAAGVLYLTASAAALPVALAGAAAALGVVVIAGLIALGFRVAAAHATHDAAWRRRAMNALEAAESAWRHAKPQVVEAAAIEDKGRALLLQTPEAGPSA